MGLKLNLGCGKDYRRGFVNCDISKEVNPDKIVDLEKKLPFENDSIEEIYAEMIIEHIENLEQLFNEFFRVCQNNAKIVVRVPFFSSYHNYTDPTHKRGFNHRTLDFYNYNNRFLIKSSFRYGEGRYGKVMDFLFGWFANLNKDIYCRFFAYALQVMEIKFTITVKK